MNRRLRTPALAGLAIVALCLAGDALPRMPYRITFLAEDDAPSRNAYSQFTAAVARTLPGLASEARIGYFTVGGSSTRARVRAAIDEHPDLVVVLSGYYAAAVAKQPVAVPTVFSSFEDPLRYGIVTSFGPRPEPRCGVSLADTLEGKRLEILHSAYPHVREVAVLATPSWADELGGRARLQAEADRLGLHATLLLTDDPDEVRTLMSDDRSPRFDAWYVPATHLADDAWRDVLDRLHAWHKPNIWASKVDVDHGAQMAYVQDTQFVWDEVAGLVARVRAGEAPGSIPILRPTHFTLVVRMTPGDGMPAPDISVVRRADLVVR